MNNNSSKSIDDPAIDGLLCHGSKFKIIITLDAELLTNTGGVTKDQICDLILQDEMIAGKSVIAGKVNPHSEEDHDTEIIWRTMIVEVSECYDSQFTLQTSSSDLSQ